jgi:hypothetical protein
MSYGCAACPAYLTVKASGAMEMKRLQVVSRVKSAEDICKRFKQGNDVLLLLLYATIIILWHNLINSLWIHQQ